MQQATVSQFRDVDLNSTKAQSTKEPGERTRGRVSEYILGKVLETEHAKRRFRELCEDRGADSEMLGSYVMLISWPIPKRSWEERIGAKESELQDLPQELETLARRLEQLFKGTSLVVPEKL